MFFKYLGFIIKNDFLRHGFAILSIAFGVYVAFEIFHNMEIPRKQRTMEAFIILAADCTVVATMSDKLAVDAVAMPILLGILGFMYFQHRYYKKRVEYINHEAMTNPAFQHELAKIAVVHKGARLSIKQLDDILKQVKAHNNRSKK